MRKEASKVKEQTSGGPSRVEALIKEVSFGAGDGMGLVACVIGAGMAIPKDVKLRPAVD